MDAYSHDYQIKKYAQNFNQQNNFGKNNFTLGSQIINNKSQIKMSDIKKSKSPARLKKRRLINAQNDGVLSQFDYVQDDLL